MVITDLGMPEIDGWQVAERIKQASSRTPVILLSGWGNLMGARDRKNEHVDEVLGKPPVMEELRRGIQRVYFHFRDMEGEQ